MDVYFAYNNSTALTLAQSLWNLAFASQVQPDQVPLGKLPSLNVPFSPSCNNGMFCVTDSLFFRVTDFAFSASVAGAVLGILVN